MNTLYYGDNLNILREYIKDESVDLVYLDPPFNSNRTYNVLFKDESGSEADAQIKAFDDTWHWGRDAEATYRELILEGDDVSKMIEAMRQFIGENQMMAYLVMMAIRLKELHRVLKSTGSLYLHCDPTASHYLKILLDTIFGTENYRNEITWKRTSAHGNASIKYGNLCDTIFYYSKSANYTFNNLYTPYSEEHLKSFYRYFDEDGRRYALDNMRNPAVRPNLMYDYKGFKPHANGWAVSLERMKQLDAEGRLYFPKSPEGRIRLKRFLDEMPGVALGDLWDDIQPIGAQAAERLGYPTQKPVELLERIISVSSNEGDIILDPFCGCGTTIAAAQNLKRQWIGIDITHLSIALQKYRLKDNFGLEAKGAKKSEPPALAGGQNASEKLPANAGSSDTYQIIGEPEDLASAQQLATEDRYQFQWWALSLVKARPLGATGAEKVGRKGSDRGIDGTITFIDDTSGKAKRVLVQVKSGHVKSGDLRDLKGTLDREKADIGVFITLESPSGEMEREAVTAGFYHSPHWGSDYPKLQILTIEELLDGREVKMPQTINTTFKKAEKISKDETSQGGLFDS